MGLATSMAGFFKSGKDAFQMRLALACLAFVFSTACAEAQESADTLDFSGIVTHTLVEAEYYLGLVDPGEGNGNPLARRTEHGMTPLSGCHEPTCLGQKSLRLSF